MKTIYSPAIHARPAPVLMARLICCLLCMIAGMYASPSLAQKKAAPAISQNAVPVFAYKIIPAANGTYGYDIYADGKLRIHQPSIPSLPGNDGFKTPVAAEKVARLVITKMKKGESLPTISPDELKKLGVM